MLPNNIGQSGDVPIAAFRCVLCSFATKCYWRRFENMSKYALAEQIRAVFGDSFA